MSVGVGAVRDNGQCRGIVVVVVVDIVMDTVRRHAATTNTRLALFGIRFLRFRGISRSRLLSSIVEVSDDTVHLVDLGHQAEIEQELNGVVIQYPSLKQGQDVHDKRARRGIVKRANLRQQHQQQRLPFMVGGGRGGILGREGGRRGAGWRWGDGARGGGAGVVRSGIVEVVAGVVAADAAVVALGSGSVRHDCGCSVSVHFGGRRIDMVRNNGTGRKIYIIREI